MHRWGLLYLRSLATFLLVAATITVFLALPYYQTLTNVSIGVKAPAADFAHQLDRIIKFSDAANVFLNASIFNVKFSFIFFFRLLLHRTGKLQVWWWCTFIVTIPCAEISMREFYGLLSIWWSYHEYVNFPENVSCLGWLIICRYQKRSARLRPVWRDTSWWDTSCM